MQCNFRNNCIEKGFYFCTYIQISLWTPWIFLWGQIYTKITVFHDFGAVSPHFKSHNGESWHKGGDRDFRHHAEFYKNRLRGLAPYGQIYTESPYFDHFGGLKSTFLKPRMVKYEGPTCDFLPHL